MYNGLGHADLFRGLEKCHQVTDVRVHTTIRDESKKMEATTIVFGMVAAVKNGLVFVEFPLLDRDIDLHNVLPDNTSSTDVQMPVECELESASTGCETHPTSELPMSPSLRPTAIPCAWSVRELCDFAIASMLVVSPPMTALPFSTSDTPHPSCTLQATMSAND